MLTRFVLPILLLFSCVCKGQDIYFTDTIGSFDIPALGTFNINNCQGSSNENDIVVAYITDLTYHNPTTDMYGYGRFEWTGDFEGKIYRFTYVSLINQYLGTEVTSNIDTVSAIVSKPSGEVFLFNSNFSNFNLTTEQDEVIGELPGELQFPACATYADGDIYIFSTNNDIAIVNEENPAESEILWSLGENILPVITAVSIHSECGDVITYAVGFDGNERMWYAIDLVNQSVTEVCDTDLTIAALASPQEPVIPPCSVNVDLDENDNTAFIHDFVADSICLPPVSITDDDVSVFCGLGYIDSIHIDLTEGAWNGALEKIVFPASNINLDSWGSGSQHISLINNGTTQFSDFETALKALFYDNDANQVFYETRIIEFQAFASFYEGEISQTTLPIYNEILNFNPQITMPACFGNDNGSITLSPSGGAAPYSILWENGTTENQIDNLAADNYQLTLTDAEGCIRWGDFGLSDPPPLQLQIENAGSTLVCDTLGILSAQPAGGTPPFTYLWSNGKTDAVASGFSFGNHTLTLTDANGCQTTADYSLAPGTGSQTDINDSFCAGETYLFADYTITNDTSFCLTLTDVQGCDSLVCLDLTLLPDTYTEESVSLCQGENFTLDGQSFTQDTFVCIDLTTFAGCDSTVCHEVVFFGSTDFIDAEICAGDTYLFNSENLNTAGTYQNVLSDANGCDSIINLTLAVMNCRRPRLSKTEIYARMMKRN